MIDPEMQDDLFDELVYELMSKAVVSEGLAHELAEVAERHANRRIAQFVRVFAECWPAESLTPEAMAKAADRVDPDVNTEVAS